MSAHFIQTSAALDADLAEPNPADVAIFAIAWSLGQLPRYTGHALRPISVAEHSLLVCEILEREHGLGGNWLALLCGLCHDAHESVTGDLSSPAKRVVGPAWNQFEGMHRVNHLQAMGLIHAYAQHEHLIHRADLQARATERRDLMPPRRPGLRPWPGIDDAAQGIAPIDWIDLDTPERRAMTWEDWRDRWLDRYHELDHARRHHISAEEVPY